MRFLPRFAGITGCLLVGGARAHRMWLTARCRIRGLTRAPGGLGAMFTGKPVPLI